MFPSVPEESTNSLTSGPSAAPNEDSCAPTGTPGADTEVAPVYQPLGPEGRAFLLGAARTSIARVLGVQSVAPAATEHLNPCLLQRHACFVTLFTDGHLHGCVGNLRPETNLIDLVTDLAPKAAVHDPRFPALLPQELPRTAIEISMLHDIAPVNYSSIDDLLSQIEPLKHGVILRNGHHVATFLPQVWEHVTEKEKFLRELSLKAGLHPDAWREPETSISVYLVDKIEEAPGE